MPKRLYRSRTERWIAGVCGGLSDYFNVDVIAPRVAFVLLALWNGVGLVLYLLLVILLPDEPLTEVVTEPGLPPVPDEREPQRRARVRVRSSCWVGRADRAGPAAPQKTVIRDW